MTKPSQPGLLRRVARALGPGLITGAADDDPSGIVTYSMAGAQHGMALRGRRSAAAARGRFRRWLLPCRRGRPRDRTVQLAPLIGNIKSYPRAGGSVRVEEQRPARAKSGRPPIAGRPFVKRTLVT